MVSKSTKAPSGIKTTLKNPGHFRHGEFEYRHVLTKLPGRVNIHRRLTQEPSTDKQLFTGTNPWPFIQTQERP
jgi:hypothetical protein